MEGFIVYLHRPVVIIETTTVMAESKEEAIEIAKNNTDIEWDFVEESESGLCHHCSNWRYEC